MTQTPKRLYLLDPNEQQELLAATENLSIVLDKEGAARAKGDTAAVKKLWRRWAKEKGFKIKSIRPCNEHENGFWATPTNTKVCEDNND